MNAQLPEPFLAYHAAKRPLENELNDEFLGWVRLWTVAELETMNREYEVPKYLPGFLGIGSNGGGELIAFNTQFQIVVVPVIGMSPNDAVMIADSWRDFESMIHAAS